MTWEAPRRQYGVAELNAAIRGLLDEEFGDIWVAGEVSGVKLAASGHYYFTLKEANATLRCVCFRMAARLLKFKPQDGIAVIARGRIDVYEARGEYQLMVESLEPQGHGALQFAFEQLKKKLTEEGLFEAERKRPLPRFPRRIGIVTSPSGAVIRDILNVLGRRHPGLHIRLYPALVQGEGAIEQVCRGLHYFHVSGWADVVILARGGGSLEDLWTFNEEDVARAIAKCGTPVISAIGHETDFTIADFVADLRAPTPSAAAELVIPPREQLLDQIENARRHLAKAIQWRLSNARRQVEDRGVQRAAMMLHRTLGRHQQRVDELDFRLRAALRKRLTTTERLWRERTRRLQQQDLRVQILDRRRRTDCASTLMIHDMHTRLAAARARLTSCVAELQQLSPLKVLARGYALVETAQGEVVRKPADAPAGTGLRVRVAEGELRATVDRE